MLSPTRLLIVLGFLAITTQAHAACEIKKFNGHSLSRCKVWPAFPDKAISAKSTFVSDSEGDHEGKDAGYPANGWPERACHTVLISHPEISIFAFPARVEAKRRPSPNGS